MNYSSAIDPLNDAADYAPAQGPIRSELFSVERLEQHAESLAAAQRVSKVVGTGAKQHTERLYANTRVLVASYRAVVQATRLRQPITPAAEWLLDNFHVVDEQIREIKNDLPPGFYRLLPKLADGPLAGQPRVFGVAWALVAHTDSAFDIQKLTRFVAAYQRVQPLTIGELWAIAITLRVTLVENLRRLMESLVFRLDLRRQADEFADRILGMDTNSQAEESEVAIRRSLDQVPWSTAFAVQLAQRLRDKDPETTPALRWLNERLAADGLTTDQLVRNEVQRQSAANVTVRNVITSMRLISTIDWAEWFESVSVVDATLRTQSDFAAMDFTTRDLYRRAIETLSRRSDLSEIEVARRAIAVANRAKDEARRKSGVVGAVGDPGYYLVSKGRRAFEKTLGCRTTLRGRLTPSTIDQGVVGYVGLITLVSVIILGLGVLATTHFGVAGGVIALLAILGAVPASDVAVSIVNRLIAQNVVAQPLPGLELKEGVPTELSSFVVVPTLLTKAASIEEQIDRLEVHYLSNPEENLHFALLSDWADCDQEHAPNDQALVRIAIDGVARLNQLHGPAKGGDRFFLLHRRRLWNPGEAKWMGWERKRGKLQELNRALRGATDTTFQDVDGRLSALPTNIRYIITLDADTRMPIGAAKRLIGKMAHPLNRPSFDEKLGRVVDGHGILQPRVTPSLPIGSQGSLFQRAFSGPNGLDPYAFAISDVYQDLFDEGSFVGKGIYDLDIVERAMHGRIPESVVLSHDLLEGIFTRAGLTSDVEVVEEFPSRYDVSAARQHRWTRGDWQLLPWIFGRGPGPHQKGAPNSITLLDRWKLLDNLRRSLSAPATLLGFIAGWLLPLHPALVWTAFMLGTLVFPPLLPVIAGVIPRASTPSLKSHVKTLGEDLSMGVLQSGFLLTFLAHQAWMMVDAIFRTLLRQFITRKRMLEWTTMAQSTEQGLAATRSLGMQILVSVAFTAAVGLVIVLLGHEAWPLAAPFAVLWVASPIIAALANRPPAAAGHLSISDSDVHALRLIGRRTWRFFEAFITPEDNWLPPDNFQEDPHPIVAHRTSPTNIGLHLVSVMAARDFGWHGVMDTLEQLEASLGTLAKLDRFKGHFYNWYDTQDLRVLEPRYVSSVDSGNLAGHLIAVANACLEIRAGLTLSAQWADGLEDSARLVIEGLEAFAPDDWTQRLNGAVDDFRSLLKTRPALDDLPATAALLTRLETEADAIIALADQAPMGQGDIGQAEEVKIWSRALRAGVASHQRDLAALTTVESASQDAPTAFSIRARLLALSKAFKIMANEMAFGFLFDLDRQLLSIGYREADNSLDANYYDLLASEARLASFFAIAKGDVPARHWFRLGRTLTPIANSSGLISWSGSMFEYLMPSLVMRAPSGSVLAQTNRLIVRRQIEHGNELGIPWGMSESQYYARDIEFTYQYSSFGVPDLGYKRGLSESAVIAPYATALGAMVDPAAAVKNFNRLTRIGARGHYGWYEAVDYTRSRLPRGDAHAVIHAYMSHHQGMALAAIANALNDGAMRARFHREPMIEAAELLLQERMPRDMAFARPPPEPATESLETESLVPEVQRRYFSPHSRIPRTQLLSNGRYSVMVTAAGSGYSRWRDVSMNRWREDVTCDGWGSYVYLRDVRDGAVWSAAYQPTGVEPDDYEVVFSEDRAEFTRTDATLRTRMEISVSPEDDAEVRRVSISNYGPMERDIELTSFAEIALARQGDDVAHPAFAKLFVETEFVAGLGAILATRRRRSDSDPEVWAAHLVVVEGERVGDVQYETDRARFLGRGQTARNPAAIASGWPLSNTAGQVLDPVFSLRQRVRIPRGGTVRLAFWTLAAPTREAVLDLADKHHDAMAFERATTLAWSQAQIQLRHLGVTANEAHLFQRLANQVLYSDPALRPPSDVLKRGGRKASTLWSQGISGDLPILLVQVTDDDDLDLVRQLLRAHEYWRLKQLAVDLVIVNERPASYIQDFQNALDTMVRISRATRLGAAEDAKGAVFVLRGDLVPGDVRDLSQSAARAVLRGGHGSLTELVDRARDFKPPVAPPAWRNAVVTLSGPGPAQPSLEFFNGLGGFGDEGRTYVTILDGTKQTPAPWVNVIANPSFGFQISTNGGGYVWSMNSQQNQITPWSNDAVGEPPGEVIYLKDEDTGEVWGPTALPIREKMAPYVVTHGQGFTRFEHRAHGVTLELTLFVPIDDPIKISRLKITNHSGRVRNLSVTAYVEWVLGGSRSASQAFVSTEVCPDTGAMMAQNPWNNEFGDRIAFADLGGRQTAWTGDRTEFIGRNGALDKPLGLSPGAKLSNRTGAGLDPCGALQTSIKLEAASSAEVVFFLGQTANRSEASALVKKYRAADLDAVLAAVYEQWNELAGAVQVKTPDRALDILVNRWLPYQTLACRVWARTGFYQASGAYGFRDQLQDVLSLVNSRPDLTRAQVLRAAGRQFQEGDFQHWWLPETGAGIRTRIADDRIWLAYGAHRYVDVTGDTGVLDEQIPFLEGPVLKDGEHDAFFPPTISHHTASLFEHCALALDKSLAVGVHGLPLMGTGDWNDGMDRVGEGGKGESVWLGWFLYTTLTSFAPIAEQRGETGRARSWMKHAQDLKQSLERNAWDGAWYRRAYFDDGTPLGSASNMECRIDSIAQSWSVISGAAEPARAQRAMAAVDKYLVNREDALILLFTPPFDRSTPNPGYIKGYPAGVRENGGQYTHAAVWSVYAFTKLGDGDKAHELLSLLNPINHARNDTQVQRYKVEPYVIAADVYSMPPHVGRGGWTWYTGSAGWTYRVALEQFLGFHLKGDSLLLDPCIPKAWPSFEIRFRHRASRYEIRVENPLRVNRGVIAVKFDGRMLDAASAPIDLVDDGGEHQIQVVMG